MIRRIHGREIQEWAEKVGLSLSDDEALEFLDLTGRMLDNLDLVESLATPAAPLLEAVRSLKPRPSKSEDPYNAIIQGCEVKANDRGLLSGMRIGLKDNMAVAGIPMTCGSRLLEGYVPKSDCVVAERLLQAGGKIVAKLNMDDFAFSAGGETSHFGAVTNPYDITRTASGSSSGPAAALHYDSIDLTFGTDQGGSIRLPASWCGVLGLKPTFGLVPYTGIASIDVTYDNVGPLARTVETLALGLTAVAGRHSSDPRQHADILSNDYVDVVSRAPDDLRGVTIGVLLEGFNAEHATNAPPGTRQTMEATREVVERVQEMGATVKPISIPDHSISGSVKLAALAEGYAATFHAFGNSYHQDAAYWEDFGMALGKGMSAFSDDLHPTVKSALILGNYLRERYFGSFYARARNWAPTLREAYDRALSEVDLIVMPTATHYAHKLAPGASLAETVWRSWTCNANTAAANISGHPALSMPAGEADGLPVGVMIVGTTFGDADLLSFARTYEQANGWLPLG